MQQAMMEGLGIRDVAAQTGLAPPTLRMWEQRYGFPRPQRTASGYRRYAPEVVETLRRIVELRERGLSVPAAISAACEGQALPAGRASIFAAVAADAREAPAQRLRKSTLTALSRAIEDEAMARAAGPVVFAAFQRECFYRPVECRYRHLARTGDAVTVFADFASPRGGPGDPVEVPLGPRDPLGNEWALIVDAPGYAACLLAWELPADDVADDERRFEALWSVDPRLTREAARVAARLAGRTDPALAERLEDLLADRPLATDRPSPALTALANRTIAYLESSAPAG